MEVGGYLIRVGSEMGDSGFFRGRITEFTGDGSGQDGVWGDFWDF